MFGHSTDDDYKDASQQAQPAMPVAATVEPTADGMLGIPAPDDHQSPSAASDDDQKSLATPTPMTIRPTAPAPKASAAVVSPTPAMDGDLMNIKQEALHNLKPLVGHLDQTPEEKFRTTMMMIQAADDQSLIPRAFEAAKAITDDKVRAQALLDVVNEINYFTTQSASQS